MCHRKQAAPQHSQGKLCSAFGLHCFCRGAVSETKFKISVMSSKEKRYLALMLLCACLVFVLLKAGGYLFHGESGLLDVLAVLCFAGMFVAYIAYFGHVLGKRRKTFLGKRIRE